ncbi:hypothetical protein FHR32_000850 [Streptosporangium album]|uniref:Uncharacterized protein n=1 Tax=Streptosporangium album TaxID=47479 RepID=A0A7W7RQW4_9ACTN|nr:hypothetical protein [Streptosporangium album]MBB4936545.1 hypothetical protein [Streptosporangium album]
MSTRTRIITLLSGFLTTTGMAALAAVPAHADVAVQAWVPLGSLLFSDRNVKTAVTPVCWDR